MAPGQSWPLQLSGWTMSISEPPQYVLSTAQAARNGSLFILDFPWIQPE